MRVDDHVEARPEVAHRGQFLVRHVGERHAVGLERRADPALVLRPAPAVEVQDPGDIEVVRRHVRRGRHRPGAQAEFLQDRVEHRGIGARDDDCTGAEAPSRGFEILFRRRHLHVLQPVAERHQVVVTGMLDHDGVPAAGNAARRNRLPRDGPHRLPERGGVAQFAHHDIARVLEGPAGVVVRRRILRREALDRHVDVRHRAVWLVAADDPVAGLHVDRPALEGARGGVKLHALRHQVVHQRGGVRLPALGGGDDPAVHRTVLPLRHGALVLEPVILEEELAIPRGAVEREEQRRLLDVHVVARTPGDVPRRGIRAIPLPALSTAHRRGVGPVALHLVEAARRVMHVGHEEHVIRGPPVVEPVGPYAGHAALGQFDHVRLGQDPPLVHGDGVDALVVRARARRRVEQRGRLVQVVQDRRLPLQREFLDVARQGQELPHPVPVVVVLDVLAPVHHQLAAIHAGVRLCVVVSVHHLLTAIDLDHRRDDGDDIVPDVLDERHLAHHQPVGQLHQHLRAARFGGVHAAGDVVDGLCPADHLPRLLLRRAPGIRQRVDVASIAIEAADRLLAGDEERNHVAPLLRLADLHEPRARRRRLRDGLEIRVHRLGLIDDAPRTHDVPEVLEGRRYRRRCRQVVDVFRGDARIAQEVPDLLRVLLVDPLLRGGRRREGNGESGSDETSRIDATRHGDPRSSVKNGGARELRVTLRRHRSTRNRAALLIVPAPGQPWPPSDHHFDCSESARSANRTLLLDLM